MAELKIVTTMHYWNEWSAHDDNTYDGPDSPMGSGRTEAEAIADLKDQIAERDEITAMSWAEYRGEVN